jgi:hypothetical protein
MNANNRLDNCQADVPLFNNRPTLVLTILLYIFYILIYFTYPFTCVLTSVGQLLIFFPYYCQVGYYLKKWGLVQLLIFLDNIINYA